MHWIKCSDRLPDYGQDVLFIWDVPHGWKSTICIGYCENGKWYPLMAEFPYKLFKDEHVTHWMPLPELPK